MVQLADFSLGICCCITGELPNFNQSIKNLAIIQCRAPASARGAQNRCQVPVTCVIILLELLGSARFPSVAHDQPGALRCWTHRGGLWYLQ